MTTFEIENILNEHADDLNAGRDTTDELARRFGANLPDLAPMLRLAADLKQILVLKPAPPELVRFLHAAQHEEISPIYISQPRRNWWFWAGAVASLVAGGAGLIAWLRNRDGTAPTA